jgi:hypothetical protein
MSFTATLIVLKKRMKLKAENASTHCRAEKKTETSSERGEALSISHILFALRSPRDFDFALFYSVPLLCVQTGLRSFFSVDHEGVEMQALRALSN